MNEKTECVLGIDTSNYKTSAAVVDRDCNILWDLRTLLKVKQGERGLRQSDALFQHMGNLPQLLEHIFNGCAAPNAQIRAVAFSERPRPVEGSYMPVFKAGISFGRTAAAALQVPCFGFSHQEGHIEAIKAYSGFGDKERFLCYHLSGGTCELLEVSQGKIRIIGGSKDLSFGQTIDRIGVKLGMSFPAGEEMDRWALAAECASGYLKKIPRDGLYFNLSGLETQCSRQAESLLAEHGDGAYRQEQQKALIRELFDKITRILIEITEAAAKDSNIRDVMFTGGVSSSQYISRRLKEHFQKTSVCVEFGKQEFSQDNAVGIALLGGKKLWRQNR